MSLFGLFRQFRRTVLVPAAAWLLVQVIMAAAIGIASGDARATVSASAGFLSDLSANVCSADSGPDAADDGLPLGLGHCYWCSIVGLLLAPEPPAGNATAVDLSQHLYFAVTSDLPSRARALRSAPFAPRAPPA